MDEQKILDAVRKAAENYWAQGTEPVKITDVWIGEEEDEHGDITVMVSWVSESTKDSLRDDMVYTVSQLDDNEWNVTGPEW